MDSFEHTASVPHNHNQSENLPEPASQFTSPDAMNDEDRAYVQVYQHLDKDNQDKKGRLYKLNE